MRILLTADPEIPVPPRLYGGIERIVDGLATELRRRGHCIGLVAHRESECRVDFFAPWPGRVSNHLSDSVRNTVILFQAVRSFCPDVLHSFSRLGYLLPLLPTRLRKLMSYQRHTGGRRNSIAAWLGGSSLVYTGTSKYIAEMGRKWGGSWFAIPNFVDTDFYRFQPIVSADSPLVFLSRVERIKGAHTAIEIARRTGKRLIIAGNRVADGEGATYWENEIARHIGHDGIEYVGPVDNIQKNELLGKARALVVPIEWNEPFGIVFAEALACGTPVISSPNGALPEIIRHGADGFLVKSVDEACAAVDKLPKIDRHSCRQRAEQCFSAAVVTEQYEQLYHSLELRRGPELSASTAK